MVAAVGLQGGYPLSNLRVLALTRYGVLGASSRLRFIQYFPGLQRCGIDIIQQAFFDDEALLRRYQNGRYGPIGLLRRYIQRVATLLSCHQFDLLWIEKEALPWLPAWVELALFRRVPFVLDFDDAVFHNYDRHRFSWVRGIYGKRLDRLMAKAGCVVAGNRYLAQRASNAGATIIELIPTVIDLNRYSLSLIEARVSAGRMPRIVWIGSPSTVRYLDELADVFVEVAKRQPFELHVIGGIPAMAGIDLQLVPWSEATEVDAIAQCDIGIMPLPDSPFERGKCGYKLIQYMACGLPVVASPVGVNSEIVRHGENGFLADTKAQWIASLVQLLCEPELRATMGHRGRSFVEMQYCLQVTGTQVEAVLKTAAQGI